MTKKYYFFILVLALAAFLLYTFSQTFLSFKQTSPSPTGTPAPQSGMISLTINFGDNDLQNFEIPISQKITAFDVLKHAADLSAVNLKTKDSEIGIFVEAIGQKEGGQENKYWLYYINDEMPMVAADKYELKPGDKIEWRFEKFNF